ncbi:MAG TPA: hypothetical protein VKW08_26600 [Xanthobacteraceae bacterium]|nr:hypothetical protein [Xanthobacteraceae bacterium]
MLKDILNWLEDTPLAIMISHGPFGFPALEMVHVTATTFVFGMIAIIDLRLLGLLARNAAVSDLYRDVVPVTWVAFMVAAISGCLLFTAQAHAYSVNFAFRMKFVVLALIGLNMLVFRFLIYPSIAKWDRDAKPPLAARLAGAVSLAGWMTVVASARWIAYLMI